MSDENFVADRILWRCGRNGFFGNGGVHWQDVPLWIRILVILYDHEKALVAAYQNDSWIVVTDTRIISTSGKGIVSCLHEKIGHEVKLENCENWTSKEVIAEIRPRIIVGLEEFPIWSPSGNMRYSLMNLLLMLPVGRE